MTLKQKRLAKAIDAGAKSLREASKIAGYSQNPKANAIYRPATKRYLKKVCKAFQPDQIKADILRAETDFKTQNDNTNRCRMLELRAKSVGLCRDNQQNITIGVGLGNYISDYENRFKSPTNGEYKPSKPITELNREEDKQASKPLPVYNTISHHTQSIDTHEDTNRNVKDRQGNTYTREDINSVDDSI